MFADDAEVVFNGGVFRQRNQGVTRLIAIVSRLERPAGEWSRAGLRTGGRAAA